MMMIDDSFIQIRFDDSIFDSFIHSMQNPQLVAHPCQPKIYYVVHHRSTEIPTCLRRYITV